MIWDKSIKDCCPRISSTFATSLPTCWSYSSDLGARIYKIASTTKESTFSAINEQHKLLLVFLKGLSNEHKNPFLALLAALLLCVIRVLESILWRSVSFWYQKVPEPQQDSDKITLPAFKEISPPTPLMYKTYNPNQPLLPSVRILTEFCKFRYFCSYPNEFTGFRSFCNLHNKDRELQFILETIHVIDYVCRGFLNANTFFDSQQVQLLLTFQQLPRSILVVNGKFTGSVVLPSHQPNENPVTWVDNATVNLWLTYVLPTAPRQLRCVRNGFIGSPDDPASIDLRFRVMKLVDIFACSYAAIEKLLSTYSVDEIKSQVNRKTNGTHVLKSQSLLQQWHQIRELELQHEQQQQAFIRRQNEFIVQ